MKKLVMGVLAVLAVGAVDYSSIAVVNNTDVTIHVQIGDDWVLYVPPGGKSGSIGFDIGDTVYCRAIVAPGQPEAGSVIDDTTIVVSEGAPLPFGCEDFTGYEWSVTR